MKHLISYCLMAWVLLGLGCSSLSRSSYMSHYTRKNGLVLPEGVEERICGGTTVKIIRVDGVLLFSRHRHDYLHLKLHVETDIPGHWENAWIGSVALRKPRASREWSGADVSESPPFSFGEFLSMTEEELDAKLFGTKDADGSSNQTNGR